MRLPIAREGLRFLFLLLALALVSWFTVPWLAWLWLFGAAFTAFFFRDPERAVPPDARTAVAPADGRVLQVRTVREERFLKADATVIDIFLSITDVHINRAPIAGRVAYREYIPGKYVAAYAPKASEINERNYVGIEAGPHRVLVCQIAGLVARRIVCWSKLGDELAKGQRFGLIRFGSCTQVFLPSSMAAAVKPGDRVRGGVTVVGRLIE